MILMSKIFIFSIVSVVIANGNKANEDEEFIPTHEWKVVKKGQAIPKGLHIRVNLETGITEAKLLEDDRANTNSRSSALLELPQVEDDEKHLDKEVIKEAIRNIKSDDPAKTVKTQNKKFRSYEELKKEFGQMNLIPKMDVEILQDLMKQHEEEIEKSKPDPSSVVRILEDFDFLVHQIDNGVEFIKHNGMQAIIYKNLNSTSNEIKESTLKLFGSLLQNNPKVQIHALETGAVPILLRILSLDQSGQVRGKAIHALSCLLRRFPLAQLIFIKNGGLSVVTRLFEKNAIKLQIKLVTLMNDLVLESIHAKKHNQGTAMKQYELVDLERLLLEQNWCDILNKLLVSLFTADNEDHDSFEKCIIAMHTMAKQCSSTYSNEILLQLKQRYMIICETEKMGDDEFSNADYFHSLYKWIEEILNVKHIKTEL